MTCGRTETREARSSINSIAASPSRVPTCQQGTSLVSASVASQSPENRSEIARKAALARWATADSHNGSDDSPLQTDDEIEADATMPVAHWRGTLNIVGMEVPCYVLDNGARVIGRTSATEVLSGIKGGGGARTLSGAKALEPFINKDLVLERFVPFRLPEVEGLKTAVKGLPAELFIEI